MTTSPENRWLEPERAVEAAINGKTVVILHYTMLDSKRAMITLNRSLDPAIVEASSVSHHVIRFKGGGQIRYASLGTVYAMQGLRVDYTVNGEHRDDRRQEIRDRVDREYWGI